MRKRCWRWLGNVLAGTTEGRFAAAGCWHVVDADSCRRGVRPYQGPAVIFRWALLVAPRPR